MLYLLRIFEVRSKKSVAREKKGIRIFPQSFFFLLFTSTFSRFTFLKSVF